MLHILIFFMNRFHFTQGATRTMQYLLYYEIFAYFSYSDSLNL